MRGWEIANIVGLIFLIVGGINWGLIGLFGFNLVAFLFGQMTPLTRVVYVLVGLAALYVLIWWPISAHSAAETRPTRAGHIH